IVVHKPASPGREKAPIVVIQSHLDMVCEKNRDVKHDFDNDPISLQRSNGHIKAKGTTLGSDNGIGVAAGLAIMLDSGLEHGPLELLFTVDEETGMTGAMGLQKDSLKGRIMLNLDSEEEGSVYVGCAGGRDTILTFDIEREDAPAGFAPFQILVSGLKGGHSGVEIHLGRGNALKVLGRTLRAMRRQVDLKLADLNGGSKRNAIPREAEALVYAAPADFKKLKEIAAVVTGEIQGEYAGVDGGGTVDVVEAKGASTKPFAGKDMLRIANFLHTVPHGVVVMSADIPGLVETSTNAAIITTTGSTVVVSTSQRSSVRSSLNNILDQVTTLGEMSGARVESSDGYPGWKPNLNSKALRAAQSSYKELFGKEPVVKAIHAGLECGLIGERFSGMDMVSFGPTIEGAHSPDERVEIASVQKFWDLLLGVLKKLSS
ncbi:MAG: aminoacyl-histidine dipeptidase, partial [Ignavibacteria bacterium]|nr:aminoacyl-histidine dipeptidase [Ignavibacteria bacterium]